MKIGLNTKLDPTKRNTRAQEFEEALRRKVVGQDDGVREIVTVFQMFLAGLNPPGRPIGNLLFLGPTGTGKTRVVEATAEALFGDPRACIKIDCAEFQHSHEIAKLIGSPPGYLGHRETHPVLTQEALNQWHTEDMKLSILLFDEIEKASDALWQLLLGILDKATLTLGDNRRVNFENCLIVMTSNLGAADMQNAMQGGFGFAQAMGKGVQLGEGFDQKIQDIARNAAKSKFTPEFMNRIDKTVVFRTLREEHIKQILEIELGQIQQRILMASGNNQFVFSCTPAMKKYLLEIGMDPQYGARHLKRALEREIVHPLSNMLATDQVKMGDFIRIDRKGNETTFVKEAEGAMVPALLVKEWSPENAVPAPEPKSSVHNRLKNQVNQQLRSEPNIKPKE